MSTGALGAVLEGFGGGLDIRLRGMLILTGGGDFVFFDRE
jgi:hypothetical protein